MHHRKPPKLIGPQLAQLLQSTFRGGSRFPQVFLVPQGERLMKQKQYRIGKAQVEHNNWQFMSRDLAAGDIVELRSPSRALLGWGFWEPSEARIDVFDYLRGTVTELPVIQQEFWQARLDRAFHQRLMFLPPATTAYRAVHGAADGLPGLFIDKFGPQLCHVSATTAGAMTLLPIVSRFLKQIGVRIVEFATPLDCGLQSLESVQLDHTFSENALRFPCIEGVENATSRLKLQLRGIRRLWRDMCYRRSVLIVGDSQGGFTANAIAGSVNRICVAGPSEDLNIVRDVALLNGGTASTLTFHQLSSEKPGDVAFGSCVFGAAVIEGGPDTHLASCETWSHMISKVVDALEPEGILFVIATQRDSSASSFHQSALQQLLGACEAADGLIVVRTFEGAPDFPQPPVSVFDPMCPLRSHVGLLAVTKPPL